MADATSDRERAGGAGGEPLVRTFLLADVRGYTRYTREHGDQAASELARRLASLVASAVPGFGGKLLEVRGDETLCVFTSARQALSAAIELQRRLRAPDEGEAFPLGVGMGLDAGEAVPTDGGYRGAALNMAGRLVSAAGPGEVLATERLVRLSGQIDGLHWTRPRSMRLKGLAEPELVVRVEPDEPLPAAPAVAREKVTPVWPRWAVVSLVVVLLVAVSVGFVIHARSGSPKTGTLVIRVRHDSVAAIDAHSGQVLADPHVDLSGPAPLMAGGEGGIWSYGTEAQSLYRVDPKTYDVVPIGIAITPTGITTAGGQVWLVDGWDGWLIRVDARSLNVPAIRTRMPLHTTSGANMASSPSTVWINDANDVGDPALLRLNPQSGKVEERYRIPPGGVAVSGPYVWNEQTSRVTEVEPIRSSVVFTSLSGGSYQTQFTAGDGYAWRASGLQLFKISPAPVAVADTIHLPSSPDAITTGGNLVWVATYDHIIAVNPTNDTITHYWRLSGQVSSITYYKGRLWAARN